MSEKGKKHEGCILKRNQLCVRSMHVNENANMNESIENAHQNDGHSEVATGVGDSWVCPRVSYYCPVSQLPPGLIQVLFQPLSTSNELGEFWIKT